MIPSHASSRIARELGQEKFARSFDTWSHLVCLLYSQLCHSISLADVCGWIYRAFYLAPQSSRKPATAAKFGSLACVPN